MPSFNEKEVFRRALTLPAAEREAFLREVCLDEVSHRELRALLERAETSFAFVDGAEGKVVQDPRVGAGVGPYVIEALVGAGGMGVVYRARHVELDKPFAIKFLGAAHAASESAVGRFRDEARLTAKIDNPRIVDVFHLGVQEGETYIVSEFVDGRPLSEVIAEQRRARADGISDARAWRQRVAGILASVADALEAAHREDVVHCDVKPSNVLIDRDDGAHLTDFGIARHLAERGDSAPSMDMLTPWYASPEQASASSVRIDQRSDIFSLGVVMYEALTLTRPFCSDDVNRVLQEICTLEPARPRSIDRTITRDLQTVCERSMEKDPRRRYQSAEYVAAELRCVLDGKPILTPHPTIVSRTRRAAWRAKRRLAVAALVIACVVGGYALRSVFQGPPTGRLDIRLTGDATRARLYARSHGTDRPVGEVIDLGEVPGDGVSLPVGAYRFTVIDVGGRFVEFDHFVRPFGDVSIGAGAYAVTLLPADFPAREAMLEVRAGEYELPAYSGHPPRTVTVASFLIDRHEVTNGEFSEFVRATGTEGPNYWRDPVYRAEIDRLRDCPVVGVTRDAMQAYAVWRAKRLPTTEEWLVASQSLEVTPPPPPVTPGLPDVRAYLENVRPVDGDATAGEANVHFMLNGNVREVTASSFVAPGERDPMTHVAIPKWDGGATLPPIGRASIEQVSMFRGFRCARSLIAPDIQTGKE